jgi:hypothetical protein
VGSEEGDAPLLMQALPQFIAQYGERGLRENAQSMTNEGRPCHWARVACAKSQGKMPTPCFGFVATPPAAEALIRAGITPTYRRQENCTVVSYVGIPHIPYGRDLPPGSVFFNDDVAEWLNKMSPRDRLLWKSDIPSAMNLAAWLHFIAKAWHKLNDEYKVMLESLYMSNHESDLELERMKIKGLPWGSLKEVPCTAVACKRCQTKHGGFAFGWQGPWTCMTVQKMDKTNIPGVNMRDMVMDAWEICAATGGCKTCLFLCNPCRQFNATQRPDDRVPVSNLPFWAEETIEYPRNVT